MSFLDIIFRKKKQTIKSVVPIKKHVDIPNFDEYTQIDEIGLIFDFIFHADPIVFTQACMAVHLIFCSLNFVRNKNIYLAFLCISIHKSDINKFNEFDEDIAVSLLCIASMNANAYSREEALSSLVKLNIQKSISFILFRLADWIPSIAKKAEGALTISSIQDNAFYFIHNYKFINHLRHIKRANLSELYTKIIYFLCTQNYF